MHLLVKTTIDALKQQKDEDCFGRVRPPNNGPYLKILISKASIERAAKYMHECVTTLEKQGIRITVEKNPYQCRATEQWRTMAHMDGESITFQLEEPSTRSKHVPTPGERESSFLREWDYTPSGRLELHITEYMGDGIRNKFTLFDEMPIQKTLNSFVEGLKVAAAIIKKRHEKSDRLKEEYQAAAEKERLQQTEEDALKQLKGFASNWDESRRVSGFLDDLERRAKETAVNSDNLNKWIAWARKYAERLDPIPQIIMPLKSRSHE